MPLILISLSPSPSPSPSPPPASRRIVRSAFLVSFLHLSSVFPYPSPVTDSVISKFSYQQRNFKCRCCVIFSFPPYH